MSDEEIARFEGVNCSQLIPREYFDVSMQWQSDWIVVAWKTKKKKDEAGGGVLSITFG